MKKMFIFIGVFFIAFYFSSLADAHFQYIIPSDDIITLEENREITIDIIFGHPFEGNFINMEIPIKFGVLVRGKNQNLMKSIRPVKVGKKYNAFKALCKIKRPGDHIFYVEPSPYFEPAEERFIVHYAKVVVNAFGLEEGWDEEIGLKTEIVPLTRPYGLWTGNVFQGIVKVFGKPVSYSEVEIEYYGNGKIKAPSGPFVTQIVKTDENGVFTYACPKAGWWAFAALNEDKKKLRYADGKEYPVEIGAVFWIKVQDMP